MIILLVMLLLVSPVWSEDRFELYPTVGGVSFLVDKGKGIVFKSTTCENADTPKTLSLPDSTYARLARCWEPMSISVEGVDRAVDEDLKRLGN